MNEKRKRKIEFGDFQTPDSLTQEVCARLSVLGIHPDIVIEPTCGVGAFVLAAAEAFPSAREILGFEENDEYLGVLRAKLEGNSNGKRIRLEQANFFSTNWREKLRQVSGTLLVIGNFPWVTNSGQAAIGGTNLPGKMNIMNHSGFDAISGKANFDISEAMLLEVLRWFQGRTGDVAMLVKTAVARKVLAYAARQNLPVRDALLIKIDAKKEFNAAVDASLLVMRLAGGAEKFTHDYSVFEDMHDKHGCRVGHRGGLTVCDLDTFEQFAFLVGESPQKWRSGVKHDASAIMEFTRTGRGLENGKGELVDLEMEYLYPLLKGSDVGGGKPGREKFVLVTQHVVGEATDTIRSRAPKTWAYLERHVRELNARGSTIYEKNPPFSVFGVGDYAFRPWRIAICGLYKILRFRLVGPIENRPVMFDDTVYYLSFATEEEAVETYERLNSDSAMRLLTSLIFWDEKRPIKTGILNLLDWSRIGLDRQGSQPRQMELLA
ncbi:MAG: SAM-dependent methyltransferase [Nitrosomonadales bacterium]|nr:SAM-dependent methyltransferase [Nitrosomonadales bacterium]